MTADHIRVGRATDCNWCPIALAVADAFDGVRGIAHAGPGFIYPYGPPHLAGPDEPSRPEFFTPSEAGNFITRFDRGEHVEPFSFVLTLKEGN